MGEVVELKRGRARTGIKFNGFLGLEKSRPATKVDFSNVSCFGTAVGAVETDCWAREYVLIVL